MRVIVGRVKGAAATTEIKVMGTGEIRTGRAITNEIKVMWATTREVKVIWTTLGEVTAMKTIREVKVRRAIRGEVTTMRAIIGEEIEVMRVVVIATRIEHASTDRSVTRAPQVAGNQLH